MAPLTRTQSVGVRLAIAALALTGVGGVLAVVAASPPTDDSWYPRCQTHALTGLHCPGCGLTRSLHALLNGDFAQAHAYHPLILVTLAALAAVFGKLLWQELGPPRRPAPRHPTTPGRLTRLLPWAALTLTVLFGILRNVPAWPLTFLAPHELASDH